MYMRLYLPLLLMENYFSSLTAMSITVDGDDISDDFYTNTTYSKEFGDLEVTQITRPNGKTAVTASFPSCKYVLDLKSIT